MNKEIHSNSLESYFNKENQNKFNTRQRQILGTLYILKTATAREIMQYLGYKELNEVRPRLTELKQCSIIHEIGKVKEGRGSVSVFAIK